MADAREAMADALKAADGDITIWNEGRAIPEILAALHAAGWAVVPREPTEAMSDAGDEAIGWELGERTYYAPYREGVEVKVYQAMLRAAAG